MTKIKTILLVCTGNSCRSVMAAGLLEKLLAAKGDYQITTAGTGAMKGMPATREVIQLMAEQNIDVAGHFSQPLSDELLLAADLILVMEKRHRESILRRLPNLQNKVFLLSEFGRSEKEDKLVNPDIPDPIGRSLDFYRQVLAIIQEGVERVAKKLKE